MITEGMKAPKIKLPTQNGEFSLESNAGKKTVVYFYPKDNTPGCSKQACAFNARLDEFEKRNVKVVGISKDSIASHKKFADKYELKLDLLSDTELEAIKAYDVWQEKKMCGKISMGVVRTTFLIDENGNIEKIWNKVKPEANPDEILEYLG